MNRHVAMTRHVALALALAVAATAPSTALADALSDLEKTPLVRALKDELKRAMNLSLPGMARPYFVSFKVLDVEQLSLVGEFGGTVLAQRQRGRVLHTDLRVGDYKKDNTNFLGQRGGQRAVLPLDEDYDAMRRQIWLTLDQVYKAAAESMEQKRATMADSKGDKERVDDFSKVKPTRLCLPAPPPLPDQAAARALVRKLGAMLLEAKLVQEGVVELHAARGTRTILTSEGTLAREPLGYITLTVAAGAQAEDGMPLKHYLVRAFPLRSGLPSLASLGRAVGVMLAELKALRTAPLHSDFSGPVLFEGMAAAQLLRLTLQSHLAGTPGMWARGSRLPPSSKWAGKLGRRVLPSTFSLVDDPTLAAVGKVPVIGQLRVDDEGVPASRVELVKGGKVFDLLTNRTPSKSFPRSNGHARAGGYGGTTPMPTTLLLKAPGKAARALRKMAVAEARKEGEPNGLIIRQLPEPAITGRLTGVSTMGGGHQMDGMLAYKVDARGKETLVRGLKLEQIEVKQLRRILAAGKTPVVHNLLEGGGMGHRGPRTGLPWTLVTPALLIEEVELTRQRGSQTKNPLLPRP